MIAARRRLAIADFLLFGCSFATILFLLWPTQPPRQTVFVQSTKSLSNVHWQRYTVTADDARLDVLKRRLARWQHPTTSRTLRAARWHQQVANYYAQTSERRTVEPIAQVSYVSDAKRSEHDGIVERDPSSQPTPANYWLEYGAAAEVHVARAAEEIERFRESRSAPVKLGGVVHSVRSLWAIPTAMLGGLAIALLGHYRQMRRPPIEFDCQIDSKQLHFNAPRRIRLEIPSSWVKIHQPAEVKIWRMAYACCVLVASGLVLIEFMQ